jgi:peptide/nickel transport system substrate-binding protein
VHQSDFPGVDRVTQAGPYTVVYHLIQRNSVFTGNLMPLSPSAIAKEGSSFSSNPVCVGPFTVDSWIPGVSVTLVKSAFYYKRSAIHLDKIVFRTLGSGQTPLTALQAGDVQVVQDSNVPPPDDPNLTEIKASQMGWTGLVINIGNKNGVGNLFSNVGTPLAQSPTLRQAFEEAIDRDANAKIAWSGLASPSCTLIPADDTDWYARTRVPCTPYDPKDAKRLVAQSGYPTPITVHLQIIANNQASQAEAQMIQSEEAAVGFNVDVVVLGTAAYVAAMQSGQFDVVVNQQQPTDPDPNSYIYNFFDSAGSSNVSGYSNSRLDYVLANALKAADPRARAVDYRVAQQIIHADRPIIVVRENSSYGIFDSDLTGIQFNPFGVLLFANAQYR